MMAALPASAATQRHAPASGLAIVAPAPRLPSGVVRVSAVAANQLISGAIALRPRNQAALDRFLASVTNQRSLSFHQYLSKGQFGARFGATSATVRQVTAQLKADGLQVTNVSPNHVLVQFRGTAERLEAAFHTGLANYRFPNGATGRGTTSAVRLPSSIAGKVITVVGLDDLLHSSTGLVHVTKRVAHVVPGPKLGKAAAGAPSACALAKQQSAFGGITDDQLANSYGVSGLYSAGDLAAGQTVDIFELEPFLLSDIGGFDQCYFGASHTSQITPINIDGGPGLGAGSGEAILDVENVSALAPAAHIHVFSAPNSTFGSVDAYNAIANADDARAISSSWGLCESAFAFGSPGTQQVENVIFEQTAAQGQSVFSSSGDDGSDDCAGHANVPVANNLSVDDPASQPYVTAVGGTTFLSTAQPPSEIVWNDGSNWGAGGGGISDTWAEPSWQSSASVSGISAYSSTQPCSNDPTGVGDDYHLAGVGTVLPSSTPCRLVPDVSGLADEFTGITVYALEFGGWTTFGGTSSSTPLWAAMAVEMDQSSFCSGTPDGLGFISPLLYDVASSSPANYAAAFNDVTVGNNDNLDVGSTSTTFPATTGYDLASGLGTPRVTNPSGAGLASLACAMVTSASRPAVTGLSTNHGTSSGGTAVVISGSNFGSTAGAVYIGNEPATVNTWATGSISITTPAYIAPQGTILQAAGPADVTVVTASPALSSAPGPSSTFDYSAASGSSDPVVDFLSPSGGPAVGGTVDIIGSGFTSNTTPTVTFGGVPATGVTVLDDSELRVTAPAQGSATCANPSDTSICQVQVLVTTSNGTSPTSDILPAFTGAVQFQPSGVLAPTPGTETVPAPTEYDYATAPTITSVSPQFGSELGGTSVTLTGTGFNVLTYEWATFGDPTLAASQDYGLQAIGQTAITVSAPGDNSAAVAHGPTVEPDPIAVGVSAITGDGAAPAYPAAGSFAFAGQPTVSAISSHVGSTAGGETVHITGQGFVDVNLVGFLAQDPSAPWGASVTTQITHVSDTSITIVTPGDLPIATFLLVCSNTGCNSPDPAIDSFTFGYPGRPVISKISPTSGPAHGGTKVTITGQLLGNPTAVLFGNTPATSFASGPALLPDIGNSYVLTAVAPPGAAKSTVDIRVKTVGGAAVGQAESVVTSADKFKYNPSPPSAPRDVNASVKSGVVTVTWKAPSDNGGDAVTGYILVASAKGQKSVKQSVSKSTTTDKFTSLKAGVIWTITVKAVNKLGAGLPASVSVKP
jgi:hypothetical protein